MAEILLPSGNSSPPSRGNLGDAYEKLHEIRSRAKEGNSPVTTAQQESVSSGLHRERSLDNSGLQYELLEPSRDIEKSNAENSAETGKYDAWKETLTAKNEKLKKKLETANGKIDLATEYLKCEICMETAGYDGDPVTTTCCTHLFCENCIRDSVKRNPACPTCRCKKVEYRRNVPITDAIQALDPNLMNTKERATRKVENMRRRILKNTFILVRGFAFNLYDDFCDIAAWCFTACCAFFDECFKRWTNFLNEFCKRWRSSIKLHFMMFNFIHMILICVFLLTGQMFSQTANTADGNKMNAINSTTGSSKHTNPPTALFSPLKLTNLVILGDEKQNVCFPHEVMCLAVDYALSDGIEAVLRRKRQALELADFRRRFDARKYRMAEERYWTRMADERWNKEEEKRCFPFLVDKDQPRFQEIMFMSRYKYEASDASLNITPQDEIWYHCRSKLAEALQELGCCYGLPCRNPAEYRDVNGFCFNAVRLFGGEVHYGGWDDSWRPGGDCTRSANVPRYRGRRAAALCKEADVIRMSQKHEAGERIGV